ncbi:MAG TPA: M1 family peptidase, partial [Rhodanobacteraceae bacterium]
MAAEAVPAGKLPADAIPERYALSFRVDPREDRFSGETHIQVRLAKPADHVWLHADRLDITKATVTTARGKTTDATMIPHADVGVLEVRFGSVLPAQDIDLAFDYTAPFNAQLEGLYKVKVGDESYAITQMEPVSARFAFPGFDEPRFKTPFDITLTVPADQVAVANTLEVSEKKSADGKWKTLSFAR